MKIKNWYKRPVLLLFLFAVVSTLVSFIIVIPGINGFLNRLDDLEIGVKDGKIAINKELPYCLTFSDTRGTKNGVVFDKNPKESRNNDLCNAMGWVGENYVIYPNDGGYTTQEIPKDINLTINKSILKIFFDRYLPIGAVLLILLTVFFVLLQNVWFGWVLKVINKIFKFEEMSFSQCYKTTLVVFTIWSAFSWLVNLIIKLMMNRVVSLSPFIFFDTILITVASLYLIKTGKIKT